jgi:hypothetical protein
MAKRKLIPITTQVYAPKGTNYNPRHLAMGTKIEMEHTPDKNLARNIAKNHLDEDPMYYKKLKAAKL